MAYNLHFINKRKRGKAVQTNSSARILSISREDDSESKETVAAAVVIVVSDEILTEARRTGELVLSGLELRTVPGEVYEINHAGDRRMNYRGFEEEEDGSAWWNDVLLHSLDLSFNKLVTLSEDIGKLLNLALLDLSHNKLTDLPNEIDTLTQLTHLSLSDNNFKILPEHVTSLSKLQRLILAHNQLSELPHTLCNLECLQLLDLSNNKFENIPALIGEFHQLTNLSLSFNNIKELPESIINLKELTCLDLSQNKFTQMPIISHLKLEILKINRNSLIIFPIYKPSNCLKELYINGNFITNLSETQVSYIPNINILEMAKNLIENLPSGIGHLNLLNYLDISFNNLNSIPFEIGYIESLKRLVIEGNPLRSMKKIAMSNGAEFIKNYLRSKNNEDSTFYFISKDPTKPNKDSNLLAINLYELNHSKMLDISNKDLSVIPDECFEYVKNKSIKIIQFSRNKLTIFPASLVLFGSTVTSLDISVNWILELPDIFHNFKCLENLNLSGNYLRYLPETFSFMADSLISLNLSHNPLGTTIPKIIFKLTSLQYLNVSDCLIMEIKPRKFLKLEKLSTLDISNNDIKTLPPQLGLCQQIKTLNISGNRTDLSQEQVASTENLLQHLRSLIRELP